MLGMQKRRRHQTELVKHHTLDNVRSTDNAKLSYVNLKCYQKQSTLT